MPQQHFTTFDDSVFAHAPGACNCCDRFAQRVLSFWQAQAQHEFFACSQTEFALPERDVEQVAALSHLLHEGRNVAPEIAVVERAFTEGEGNFLRLSLAGKIDS